MTDPKSPDRHFFWTAVDRRSRRAMTEFLSEHYRYNAGHSWNRATSYACNLKVCGLGLDSETVDRLLDLIQVPEFYVPLDRLADLFNAAHEFRWQAAWNGRSGGYLVLYQGEQKSSGHRSYCTRCGQPNYTSVAQTGNICGRSGASARVDYDIPPMQTFTYPYRGTDDGADFEDWSLAELRDRTELVQDFDRLADDIVTAGLYMAQKHTVEERTVLVPAPRLVMV